MNTLKKIILHPAVLVAEAVIAALVMLDLVPMCATFGAVITVPLMLCVLALAVQGIMYLGKKEYRQKLNWTLRITLLIPIGLYVLINGFLLILYIIVMNQ